jgi:hypothetical protein
VKFSRFIILFMVIVSSAFAKIWNVSDSVATIQAAIDTAASGDTVLVKAAFQNVGPIEIIGKRIALLSKAYLNNPSNYNIATGAALYDTLNNRYLVKISSADSTMIKGFLFDNSDIGNGGGVLIENSQGVQLEGVYFDKNRLQVEGGSLNIDNVQFYESNAASYDLINLANTSLNMNRVMIRNSEVDHLIVVGSGCEINISNLAVYGNTCSGELYQIGSSTASFDFITSYGNTTPGETWQFNSISTWTTIRNSVLEYAPPLDIAHCEVTFSAVPGNYPGTGNLSLNPRVDTLGAFPALLATSPCISAANPDTNGIQREDILGHIRPNPEWAPPDMGAFESERHMLLNDDHRFWVSKTGDDIWGNGSVEYPFASLQAAVDYAAEADTLLLMPGTYILNTLVENKSVTIASQYLLSGDPAYRDSVFLQPDTSVSESILLIRNVDSLKLAGLTFTGGTGREFYNNYSFGGAIYCENSQLELENSNLMGNRSDYCGGALYALGSDLHLKNVHINNNRSYLGGAMALSSSAAYLDSVIFHANEASSGGAVYVDNNSKIVSFYTEFTNNNADTDLLSSGMAKPASISQYGGAIFASGSELRLHNTLIGNNRSVNLGGAIALNYGSLDLVQSTLVNNVSDQDTSGVIYVSDPSGDIFLLNSILWNPGEREFMLENADMATDHSLVYGGSNNMWIDENSSAVLNSSLTVDPGLDDQLNFIDGSPCLNAGIASYTLGNYYLINYNETQYDGSAPHLGHAGARPTVHFELVSIESDIADIPESYHLIKAYPNPFNPSTTLEFALDMEGLTRLSLYDINGRHVTDILDDELQRGRYKLTFNATTLPSGIYIARLSQNGHYLSHKKLLLVK